MKRLVPAALAVLMLAGCSAAPQGIGQGDYVRFVGELDSYKNMDEPTIQELGKSICDLREKAGDNQAGIESVYLSQTVAGGFDAHDVGAFLVYATARYCPEYLDQSKLDDLR